MIRALRMTQADLSETISINVSLLDDEAMRWANKRIFGRDNTTDVITVSYDEMTAGERYPAELLVNYDLAMYEGRCRQRAGWNGCFELALYLAHGCDHLAGADDSDPGERRRMLRRERRWVRDETALISALIDDPA